MDLQLEVQKLRKKMWENKEVFLESEVKKDLKKKLKKLMDYFISLTGLYKEQQHEIKKLKEETIQKVGKALISFILTQSD